MMKTTTPIKCPRITVAICLTSFQGMKGHFFQLGHIMIIFRSYSAFKSLRATCLMLVTIPWLYSHGLLGLFLLLLIFKPILKFFKLFEIIPGSNVSAFVYFKMFVSYLCHACVEHFLHVPQWFPTGSLGLSKHLHCSMSVCGWLCPAIDWYAVKGVPCFVPHVQVPCRTSSLENGWMDGWIVTCFLTKKFLITESDIFLSSDCLERNCI